jgi:fatty-acyl-CoA synthase
MIEKLEGLGISVTHVYGLTEVYGPYTICEYQPEWSALEPEERAARMARQGVPMIQSGSVRIVDEQLLDVPADGLTLGEIVMRGNNVMVGYFRDESATEEAFAGGWFHSGDLGVMHPDGYIEVKDRSKDLLISGGENISSIEIENALLAHPAVADAAVVAMPHEKWGERPAAFVVLRSAASSQELTAHVRGLLAGYKVPDSIEFLEALPRTSTGKVLKRALRDGAARAS